MASMLTDWPLNANANICELCGYGLPPITASLVPMEIFSELYGFGLAPNDASLKQMLVLSAVYGCRFAK